MTSTHIPLPLPLPQSFAVPTPHLDLSGSWVVIYVYVGEHTAHHLQHCTHHHDGGVRGHIRQGTKLYSVGRGKEIGIDIVAKVQYIYYYQYTHIYIYI